MKIFQLIDWLTKLFKLNNRSKIILLILLPLPIFSQNNAAFWLGKRASGAATTVNVEYVVVAGGGGGGQWQGSGGGAGGYRSSVSGENSGGGSGSEASLILDINTNYQVTIGSGGSGNPSGTRDQIASSGSNSVFYTITSIGGGFGSNLFLLNTGGSGGSGGGYGGTGTLNQGYRGGLNIVSGGGGANQVGQERVIGDSGGDGGSGIASNITGVEKYYSGGGGAGVNSSYPNAGLGGIGGGGDGGRNLITAGENGTANTGGGGGGGGRIDALPWTLGSGSGGSGVVIIRIPSTANNVLIGSGLQYKDSSGVTQNGNGTRVAPSYTPTGYKVYEFVGGTGNIQF